MPTLKGTTVRRGGVTAHYWYETIKSVCVSAATELHLSFSMSSKGGGRTQVQMEIRPEDFSTIVEMMSLVDRQAAMEAMSAELARQISTQPEYNTRIMKEARESVQKLARDKYMAKPYGEDQRERMVNEGVRELISEMEEAA